MIFSTVSQCRFLKEAAMLHLSLFFVLCVLFFLLPTAVTTFFWRVLSITSKQKKKIAFDAPQLLSTAIKQKKKKRIISVLHFFFCPSLISSLISSRQTLKHKHLPSQGLCGASSKSRPMKDCQPTVHIVERDACLSDRIWYRLILKKKKKVHYLFLNLYGPPGAAYAD